ncbi:xanthine dehydrogenase/oxidase-like [Asterias rubens]|uniref:xanthine dehydrogenase/oxidase-like n=1 Tax=Asterias rubens TaxID=7604 RepID=UPI00145585A0|nr:xanthine dehydrogenase/oxidase-like [Asterias rubens]XP_033625803.1 xanthine dehydrogenase/oxidase-like [Asterias rubens]
MGDLEVQNTTLDSKQASTLRPESDALVFFCNGKKVVDHHVQPELTVLAYLRTKLRLTGSKLGCGEGGCGACTVMVSRYSPQDKTISHLAVNACLAPICSVHGMAVTTVEGLGSTKTRLHPVQERLAKAHGSQCGFCTPGIVMSMYALLRNSPEPTIEEIESAFEGNLCRCTGYRPILQGYKTFTKDGCCGGNKANCCMNNLPNGLEEGVSTQLFDPSEFAPYDASQEPIFPPELLVAAGKAKLTIQKFVGDRVIWLRPATLQQLLELKANHKQAKMVVGNTEVGVEVKYKHQEHPIIIDASHVPDLTVIEPTPSGVKVGASVSLTSLNEFSQKLIQEEPEYKTRVFAAIVEMLKWFAGHQIRNVACIGGNIATGSPISDLNPLFMAAVCSLELKSTTGTRTVVMDSKFFTGYRKNIIGPDEVILNIHIPFTSQNEYFCGYKQAPRRVDDIAIVNAGMRVVMKPGINVVEDCTLAFGGMAATTVLAMKTMNNIKGRTWSDGLVDSMCPLLAEDLPLPPGAPGGMETYRQSLTLSFFFKFYLVVLEQINQTQPGLSGSSVSSSLKTANQPFSKNPARGVQMYQEVPSGQPETDAVGRPVTHLSALKQATGEAKYCDDIPHVDGELYLALVLSQKAHAKILSVDASVAIATEGVHAYVDINDVPGQNMLGSSPVYDDMFFADNEVTCVGQVIGVIVADDQAIAQRAARLVKVDYEELPAIITVEQAVEQNSFFPLVRRIKRGNVEEGFENSDHILEGDVRSGAQEHFYMETYTTLIIPGEDGEVEVISSTQSPTKTQTTVAKALGVPSNKVVSKVKRLGGGFGGKESRNCIQAGVCAVAANKVNRPVRLMLDRREDMMVTGTRHPYLSHYKVGFSKEGQLKALQVNLYSNSGCTYDWSHSVLEKTLFHIDNCYNFHNVEATGHLCRTNLASNTAFRGFGGPQGMIIGETILSEIAIKLALDPLQLRVMNIYKEGEKTHYSQELKNWYMDRCWKQCVTSSDYANRRRDVDQFNSESRWKKRGLALTPTKFGVSFAVKFLNQAGALVHIYMDGSVLIAHGGTEMGQGLHTKMIQVASRTLKIPYEKIHISETSTTTVPNTSPTAASYSSDLNGMAVKDACEILLNRLEPFMLEDPKGTWEKWVDAAYYQRVSLSTTGFFKASHQHFDWETSLGNPYNYFVYGVAVSEVEIDCLTGDHQVLRTDIVIDVGDSLNPAVDIGQIEGAFVQGYGMFVMEDYRVTPGGHLLTSGPGFYKIPGFDDIPAEFNVSLLTRAPNPFAICSSKAVGEPPLFLAASIYFAIKDAIVSAREDEGIKEVFRLDCPATAERIRMACQDKFTKQFPAPEPGTYRPFFVRP